MVTTQEVMERVAGKWIAEELVAYLEHTFPDFTDVHGRFNHAVKMLRNMRGESKLPSVDDLTTAIDRQTASSLFFSGMLGLKSNWDHFIDPMARTVLDVDFDVFLCENTARRLSDYEKAQAVIDCFMEPNTPEENELCEEIAEYIAYLETVGPKLAHYYGFVLGNEIFARFVPGFCPDSSLASQYRSMLGSYLGWEF